MHRYLWNTVYYTIGMALGQSLSEVHEGYKSLFKFPFDYKYNQSSGRWEFVAPGDIPTWKIQFTVGRYIMQVRSDAEIDMGLRIPMPCEVESNTN